MKKNYIHLIAMATLISIVSGNAFAAEKNTDGSSVERYALYIGSNVGGNNRRLLYAGTDATSFQNTMAEIGGIRKSNSILLLDPAKDDVDNAMEYISTLINRNKENARRSEFVFYYSGHSDENALLLGKNTYDYSSLKASISKVPSDVHVVILDSCYSGNFIRTKGGQKQKPFLVDDSSVIKGHAYLSSSSSQEYSQESDEIGSSFFTNAMITGLRGAADTSGDKKVTLNELYSYAFSETLSKTENSSVGPQHPNYNITLVGSGDLVLSDISESDCILTLKKELSGRVIIRDKNEKLVSEINKTAAGPIYLAMEAGQYGVTVISESVTLQGSFELGEKKNYILGSENLSPVLRKSNAVRGEIADAAEEEESSSAEDLQFVPVSFSIIGNEFYREVEKPLFTNLSFGLIRAETYKTEGAMISIVANKTTILNGFQASYIYNRATELNGFQFGGIVNRADSVLGAQGAGFLNVAKDVRYCQGSGYVNVATGEVAGVQGSGIINYAGKIDGVQGAGIGNVSKGNMNGVQGAGIFNIAGGDVNGVQGSAIFNAAVGNVDGVQGAAIFNVACGSVDGVQGSVIFNFARSLDGFQCGFINICAGDADGLQLGLINYSKNGIFDVGVSVSTEKELVFALNSGNKHLYSILGYAMDLRNLYTDSGDAKKDEEASHVFLGLGTKFEVGRFGFDLQAMAHEIIIKDNTKSEDSKYEYRSEWYPSVRAAVGFRPNSHFELFAGAMVSFEAKGNSGAFTGRPNSIVVETSDSNVKLHPEFDAGIKIRI